LLKDCATACIAYPPHFGVFACRRLSVIAPVT
jgi:hypothetical protein